MIETWVVERGTAPFYAACVMVRGPYAIRRARAIVRRLHALGLSSAYVTDYYAGIPLGPKEWAVKWVEHERDPRVDALLKSLTTAA
jgi:hypothetical protein